MSIYCYDGQVSQGARARQEERMRELEASRELRQARRFSGKRGRRRPWLSALWRRWLGIGRRT